jgi:plasmid maintenance system antidote protein VapI
MRLLVNKQETPFTSLEWSGSKYNAARRLEFSYPSNLSFNLNQGSAVELYDGDTELFSGFLFRKSRSHQNNEISLLSYDPMIYVLKSSGSYNFKTTTIGNVFTKVAADLGIPLGHIEDSGTLITLEPQLNQNCYEVILEPCRQVKKKTNKIYLPKIIGGKLSLITAGEVVKKLELANSVNLLDSTYSETIENVVNKVIITDDKGKRIGQVTGEGLNTWGTFQSVYEKEDKKNPSAEAKLLLHGLDREASVEALGDIRCISGKAVVIKDPSNLKGLFYIDEDTHRWENGQHTMNLTLNFKNEMEE